MSEEPVSLQTLTDFICDVEDRLGPGCDELAIAEAILRKFHVTERNILGVGNDR